MSGREWTGASGSGFSSQNALHESPVRLRLRHFIFPDLRFLIQKPNCLKWTKHLDCQVDFSYKHMSLHQIHSGAPHGHSAFYEKPFGLPIPSAQFRFSFLIPHVVKAFLALARGML